MQWSLELIKEGIHARPTGQVNVNECKVVPPPLVVNPKVSSQGKGLLDGNSSGLQMLLVLDVDSGESVLCSTMCAPV